LLAKKGLSVDDACEVAKELAPKLKWSKSNSNESAIQ
jgi:hypothetical protein